MMMKYISLITDVFFWERNSPSLFTLPFFQHIFIMCKCYFWTENIIYFFFFKWKTSALRICFSPIHLYCLPGARETPLCSHIHPLKKLTVQIIQNDNPFLYTNKYKYQKRFHPYQVLTMHWVGEC